VVALEPPEGQARRVQRPYSMSQARMRLAAMAKQWEQQEQSRLAERFDPLQVAPAAA